MSAEPTDTLARWSSPNWRASVEGWIAAELGARGIRPAGPLVEHRVRFWAVHLTVETDAGRFWFKENCPQQAFEAKVIRELGRLAGDRMITTVTIEPDRGWILSPDHGPTLLDRPGGADADTWRRLLVDYAMLQRAVLDDAEALRDCGLTIMEPAAAVAYLERQVGRLSARPEDDPARLAPEQAARLLALRSQVEAWADTLAATGLPLTLEHTDLHTNNAFDAPLGQPLRLFDFGDAVLGHPLCSLLVPIRLMTRATESAALDPDAVDRVVADYLDVFDDLVAPEALRAAVPAALQLGKLNRHESWRRTLVGADDATMAEFGSFPAAWLSMLGDPRP